MASFTKHIDYSDVFLFPLLLYLILALTCFLLHFFLFFSPGLPKPAVITQLQALKSSAGLWAFGCTSNDVIYITLPLYHSAGSLLGIGGCVELGKLLFSAC